MKLEPAFTARVEGASGDKLSLCYQCGTCTAVCPAGVPVRSLIRGSQLGAGDSVIGNGRLWYCATCKLCELGCPRGVKITDTIHSLRVAAYEGKKVPQKLEGALWGVYEDANPWGGKKADRAKWAEGLAVKQGKPAKYLLYVGCAASFDPRLQHVARSLASIMTKAGVDFSILGSAESCCGDVVYQMGEEGFLEELVKGNIQAFAKTGAEAVISISPHCFNMFRTVYPKYGGTLQALHYTEFLAGLLDGGSLGLGRLEGEQAVTYHDPCYLGRYHGLYEQPRKLIEGIPGVKLREIEDTKANALCCGGGGGRMWVEADGERPSLRRVKQAAETGASQMVTSCPYCIQNFEDSAKTAGVRMSVVDVSEVIARALGLDGGSV
jgi:Fe-S oxidoreductase